MRRNLRVMRLEYLLLKKLRQKQKAKGFKDRVLLIKEGKLKAKDFPDFGTETGFKPPQSEFIDGITYDGTKPNAYLEKFNIGLKSDDKL